MEEPVIPVPKSAYALLCWQNVDSESKIECVRFAWGTNPERIESVCPEDLCNEVVRRRAVFHLQDSIRQGRLQGYAIQKLASDGSTHFPELVAPD